MKHLVSLILALILLGAVAAPAAAVSRPSTPSVQAAADNAHCTSSVVFVAYDGANFTGSIMVWYIGRVADLGLYGWNDRIRSAQSCNNRYVNLYTNTGYTGSITLLSPGPGISNMSPTTSSYFWN